MEKNTSNYIENVQTIAGVKSLWQHCLAEQRGKSVADETQVAAHMVGVISNDKFEVWNENEVFVRIFEIAASLELPEGDKPKREQAWQEIEQLLAKL